jgi:glycosyltransferase involved in cell wall biosynthesis
MQKLNVWYRRCLLPRFVFLPFWVMRLLLVPLGIFRRSRHRTDPTKLCIEAGIRGWDSIEFKELYASSCEYLDEESVRKIVIDKDSSYLAQVRLAINTIKPTHYLYDPRTGSQNWIKGLWEAIYISLFLHARGIIPVVLLTDLALRKWRTQSAIVTARRGVVISFIAARQIAAIFPHHRIVAPSLMPFSEATLNFLADLASKRIEQSTTKAIFVGSLYEPRTSMLASIAKGLREQGHVLEIHGRGPSSPRISDQEYWASIVNASVIVTTANQVEMDGADWTWIDHMVYRYLEVIACGTLLVAPDVPGVRRYFTPSVHFASFGNVDEAIEVIAKYLTNSAERKALAKKGSDRARALVCARTFWTGIDAALGADSLT